MRLFRFLALVAALVAVVSTPLPALAQESVTLKISNRAALLDGGQAVSVSVTARCAAGGTVLESFVYVVQDGHQSQFAGVPLACDGAWHRMTVRVGALDFVFHAGRAQASGFVLLDSGASISPTQAIRIRG